MAAEGRVQTNVPRNPVVVGVIGAGANTKKLHIPNLQQIPGVVIKTICNRSLESSKAAADAFNVPKVTTNWQDIMDDPEINAVVIGTWPYMHCTLTRAALEAGKHVLCEARMAMNAKEAREMLAASRQHPQLVAQLVPSPFTLPFDNTIRRLLRQGAIGEVVHIEVRGVGRDWPESPGAPLTWRQDAKLSGLNILFMGIFYEALIRWVGGAKRVMAMGKVVPKIRSAGDGTPTSVQVPDHVDIIAEMYCGAQAHLVFSSVTGGASGALREFWLYGTHGSLHLDLDAGELRVLRKGGVGGVASIPDEERGFWRVEEEFVNAIRGVEAVKLTDFSSGVDYMEFTEAVWRSMQTGQAVHLPLLE